MIFSTWIPKTVYLHKRLKREHKNCHCCVSRGRIIIGGRRKREYVEILRRESMIGLVCIQGIWMLLRRMIDPRCV